VKITSSWKFPPIQVCEFHCLRNTMPLLLEALGGIPCGRIPGSMSRLAATVDRMPMLPGEKAEFPRNGGV